MSSPVASAAFERNLGLVTHREQARLAEIERRRQEQGVWGRARSLRAYVRALQRALAEERLTAKRRTETIDFLDWADRTPGFEPRSPYLRSACAASTSKTIFPSAWPAML